MYNLNLIVYISRWDSFAEWLHSNIPGPIESKGIGVDEIAADPEFCQLLASLKYIRVNYNPMTPQAALYETLCQPLKDL